MITAKSWTIRSSPTDEGCDGVVDDEPNASENNCSIKYNWLFNGNGKVNDTRPSVIIN
jgi:hypothetical protein